MNHAVAITDMISLAKKAGEAILEVYRSGDFSVEAKADNSPLTRADTASHDIIEQGLNEKYPDIPVLSEESKDIDQKERKSWKTYFLVDPLDGTKEFIKKNGEFTVNIALIQDGVSTLGVVFAPDLDLLYYGGAPLGGAWREIKGEKQNLPLSDSPLEYTIVASRSHRDDKTNAFISKKEIEHQSVQTISIGSSLKIAKVAEGSAHIYPRFHPCMEWDIAAGLALLGERSGKIYRFNDKDELLVPEIVVE